MSKKEDTTATPLPSFRGERLAARKAAYVGSRHSGDALAVALVGMTPRQVVRYAEHKMLLAFDDRSVEERMADVIAGVVKGGLMARYDHLNDGQKRMNAANLLRGAIARGELKEADVLRELAQIPKLNRNVVKASMGAGSKTVATRVSTMEALRIMATMLGRTVTELTDAGADLGNPGILADGSEVSIDYVEA